MICNRDNTKIWLNIHSFWILKRINSCLMLIITARSRICMWYSMAILDFSSHPNCSCLFAQEAARQRLHTRSAQQAWWTQWVGHAGRASCRAAAAAGRLGPKIFLETGSGAVVETTSTTATALARSLWMPVNVKRPLRKAPWRAPGSWWISITTKQDGGWASTFKDFLLYILRALVKWVCVLAHS